MQASENQRMFKANHRKVQSSTTLNRRYTKRPVANADVMVPVKRSPKVQRFNMAPTAMQTSQMATPQRTIQEEPIQAATPHPIQNSANAQMRARIATREAMETAPKISAKELKEQAIRKALASAENISKEPSAMTEKKQKKVKSKSIGGQPYFGLGRVLLAMSCAAAAVFAIVYFVNLNMPDISLRVAAMQTGMDPTYPNYIPRDYNVSSITSEDAKITIEFTNNTKDGKFSLSEEKSSWDTNALVSNYVEGEFGDNYSVVREQGLTIYISGSNAAWVNGGIVYKLTTESGDLTNKQIRSIATSLQ